MRLPFGHKERERKQALAKARNLLNRLDANREEELLRELNYAKQEHEKAMRSIASHATTIWQLQMLVDRLKEENYRLQDEKALAARNDLVMLTQAEARNVYRILDMELGYDNEEDSAMAESIRPEIVALMDRLRSSFS